MDNEEEGLDEEIEEREPQVTSSDPNERKLARRLRIERRLEAIRKLNAPEGEEEEEEVQKTLLQLQLQKSYELLEKLTIEGNELITNVRVANDAREVDRREVEGINREKIIEQLEEEARKAEEQFNEISLKWASVLKSNDPLQIHDDIISQKEKCDELIKQKDEVIAMFKSQIKNAEINFATDQHKQNEDIATLTQRIEKQIAMMRRAYRQELQLIEDVIMIERKMLIDANNKRWEELHKRRDQEEEMNSDKKFEQLEEFEEMCTQLRVDHQEKFRETKIKLENDIELLQQDLEEIKTLALMNSEKIDYNYQVLKKREDENIIIKSQQKRRINKLQDAINSVRHKIMDYTASTNNEIEKLTSEVRKLQVSVLDVEAKADHFTQMNDVTYRQVWDLNKKAAAKVLNQITTTDRILYEQQLGLKWVNPEHNVLDKTDLPSYKSALQVVQDMYKTGEEVGSKEKSSKLSGEKSVKSTDKVNKKEESLIPEGETMAHRRLLRLILRHIADKSGFLIEERLKDVLKPYSDEERTLVRVDSVFAALQIKRKEDVEILLEYFLPYTHCPICSGSAPNPSVGSSETEIISHSFSSTATSDSSAGTFAELTPQRLLAEHSFTVDTADIMSAIQQPSAVIDHIVSNIIEKDTSTVSGFQRATSGKHEVSHPPEDDKISYVTLRSTEHALTGRSGKLSKSSSATTTTKLSCQKRHPLVISSVYILRALRQFVSQFYEAKEGVITMASRLAHKRSTISRLIVDEDIEMYWNSFMNVFSSAREELWDGLMIGLHKYHEILKDRKKLIDEVVVLRRQNVELKYLLYCYKKDEKNKLKPPCALQREIPIKPTGL